MKLIQSEGVETRWQLPKEYITYFNGKGVVQTTKQETGSESYSGKKIPRAGMLLRVRFSSVAPCLDYCESYWVSLLPPET